MFGLYWRLTVRRFLLVLSGKLSERELKRLRRKAKKDVKFLNDEINLLFALKDYFKKEQSVWAAKIKLLNDITRPFKKRF